MQPKFTLNTGRNVLTRILAIALVLFASAQFSFGQKTEAMRTQLSQQTDAVLYPNAAVVGPERIVLPVRSASPSATSRVFAPATLTTQGLPEYTGQNTFGAVPSIVSFTVQNTNGFAIVIQSITAFFDPAVIGGNPTGSNMRLWYSTSSLSGDPLPISGPTWLVAGTSTMGAVGGAGYYPVMSGLTLQIPGNTTYRLVLESSLGLSYSGFTGTPIVNPNQISGGGVNLQNGNFQISGQNVGYAGPVAGALFTPRYFTGSITFDQAVCIPANATQPIISSVPSSTCAGSPITLSIISGTLNGASQWRWYTGSCGGTLVGTGTTLTVSPGVTTTYYVRGEGGCAPAPGPCGQQTITVTPCTCLTPDVATICSGSIQQLSVTPTGATTQTFGPGPAVSLVAATGSPYPSTINVAGLPTAGVYVQSVAINGISHTWPEDIDIALLSPTGQQVILMSDVGGPNPIGATNVIINDAGASFTANTITAGTYKPTNLVGVFGVEPDAFPAPGIATPTGPLLSSFSSGNNPNGQWRLLVVDDFAGDVGALTGWSITFRIVPTASWTSNPAAPNTMFTNPAATTPYVAGAQSDVIWVNPTATTTYTATFAGGACAPTQNVTVTVLPRPNITVSPNPGGCAPVTLTASGGIAYTWSPGTGLSTTTGATTVATPSSDQTYTVLGYGANGCSNTTTVPVKGISTAAVITAAPAFQYYIDESFNAAPLPGGWSQQNNSQPVGVPPFNDWHQGTTGGVFAPNSPPDFREVAFLSGSGLATLSNWMLSPEVPLEGGNEFVFHTIAAGAGFPDRMQIRMSVSGASTNVGATATSVGDFTTLLLDINPTYSPTGYPLAWTPQSIILPALPAGTTGRFAFRYFVENGGPNGGNSNVVGVDDVKYRKALPGVCPNTVSTVSVNITGGVAPYTLVFTNGTTNTTYPGYTSGTPIQVSPSATTNYTIVSVIGANGCPGVGNTGTATITVIQPPAITAQPASTAVCVGGSATFSVTATPAVSSTTYQWEVSTNGGGTWTPLTNVAPYSGVNTPTLTVNLVTSAMNGYRYRVRVGGQCPPQPVTSNGLATLQVNVPPTITTQPVSTTVCDGKPATFSVVATTTVGTVSYQWQQSVDGGVTWTNAAGASATTANYTFTASLAMNNYRYRVVVSVAPCASTVTSTPSTGVVLTVNPLPVVTITSADLAITPGQQTIITGTSNPAASATGWSWTLNGAVVPPPPATPSNTSSISVGIDGLGVYQATATTATTGCTNTSNLLTIGAEASDRLWIYPNPNNGNFQIRLFYDGNAAERRRIRIYNSQGALVAQKEFDLVQGSPSYAKMEFQLPKLAAGTYVAKVSGLNSESIISGLFVVAQ